MPNTYSNLEYANMVFIYGFCNGSATAAVEEYRQRYPHHRHPTRNVFIRVFSNLCENGNLPSANITSERATRQGLGEVENILDLVEEDATTSSRRIGTQLGIPQKRVLNTLHEQGLYPYHVQRVQHLQPEDYAKRIEFCRWINNNHRIVSRILFTDEATFTRDGINNTRNSHVWSIENPHATVESNFQHKFSVNVWCGMLDSYLIGPFILENRLTGDNYLNFLQHELQGLLEDVPVNIRRQMYYQHDGAPAHFARQVKQHLDETFPGRWIGRGGPINWPPRSPDLTALDYCLWGWFKNEVYKVKVDTRDALIRRIRNTAANFKEERHEAIRRATGHLRRRTRKCLEVNGGIFEHLLKERYD